MTKRHFSDGPPLKKSAPSGGSLLRETTSVGATKPSLRSRVIKHVVVPLVVLWALGTAVALGVANYFASQAFDRSLLDDAYAVAANVRMDSKGPALNLSPPEMSALLFDQSESMYFAVLLPNGALLAGHAGLRPPPLPKETAFGFAHITYQNRALRSVSLRRYEPTEFTVVVAQTTAARNRLLQRMLSYSVVPQVLLLVFLVWWLRRVIQRDLLPLAELQRAVDQRGVRDLSPMPLSVTTDASTRDVQRLGTAVNSLMKRLDDSITAQREFAGNVAHELRTPLAGIRVQADYALANTDPAIWREQLQGIARGQERASHLVEQLLGLALADEARASLQLVPIALHDVARDGLLRHLPQAAPPGGGPVGCTDNGPGMTPQEAEQLGQRWSMGPAGQRLGEGAGLGLAIVSRYAALLGARLSLKTAPSGQGLLAKVTFP